MDYNKTNKERHQSMAEGLAIKLKQEKKIISKLKKHFKTISGHVKDHYSNTGKLPSFNDHKKSVKNIINDHYIETAGISSSTMRNNFQPLIDDDDEAVQGLIDSNIEKDADERSDFAAESIANTTRDDFKSYIKEAVAIAAASSLILSDDDIADQISDKFDDTSDGRIDLISMMETGIAFTDGKFDELEAINDVDAEFQDGTNASDYEQKKTWVAILDERTRESHAEADGQEVNIDEPFEVDGEALPQPRDDSLGASPENIINCRCESEISMGLSE